jgi:kynurenine formamidase
VAHQYRQLLARTDGPPGSTWGLFGEKDEIGTLNLITPDVIRRAARLARRGQVFNLDYPINAFDPPTAASRRVAAHRMFQTNSDQRDDFYDSFYPQATSQIDGLRHQRHALHGFYNGTPDDEVAAGTAALGIARWAERGIVGRGLLVDIDRFVQHREHRSLDHRAGESISIDAVQAAIEHQGCEVHVGDILLLHTGWTRYFFNDLSDDERRWFHTDVRSAGLRQSRDTLAWLWDHGVATVAADNVAVEAIPAAPDSPFHSQTSQGLMHQELIALLGLALGELWNLDELARDCDEDGVYEVFLCAKPLNLVGGVGSPANAIAIK